MRSMILPAMVCSALLGLAAAGPAGARTGCDSYGRCFEFSGPSDRLGDGEALWQRPDAEAVDPASGDPLALANGVVGEPLQALADDD